MLAFGRLVADNEITALRTSGISFWRIARVPLLFGLGAFLLSWFINEELAPKATQLSTRTFYQIIYHTSALPIEPQIFRKDPTTGRVFFVNTVDSITHEMSDVMIFDRGTSSPFDSVMTAKQAYIKDGKLHLQSPTIIRFKPSGFVDVENRSEEITVGLPLDINADEFFNQSGGDPTSLDSKTLSSQIKALQANRHRRTSDRQFAVDPGVAARAAVRLFHRNSRLAAAGRRLRPPRTRARHGPLADGDVRLLPGGIGDGGTRAKWRRRRNARIVDAEYHRRSRGRRALAQSRTLKRSAVDVRGWLACCLAIAVFAVYALPAVGRKRLSNA